MSLAKMCVCVCSTIHPSTWHLKTVDYTAPSQAPTQPCDLLNNCQVYCFYYQTVQTLVTAVFMAFRHSHRIYINKLRFVPGRVRSAGFTCSFRYRRSSRTMRLHKYGRRLPSRLWSHLIRSNKDSPPCWAWRSYLPHHVQDLNFHSCQRSARSIVHRSTTLRHDFEAMEQASWV